MKNLIPVLLLFFMIKNTSYSQNFYHPQNDKSLIYKQQIDSCSVYEVFDDSLALRELFVFNKWGNIEEYQDHIKQVIYFYKYDITQKLVQRTTLPFDQDPYKFETFVYNDHGQLLNINTRTSIYGVDEFTEVKYSYDGEKLIEEELRTSCNFDLSNCYNSKIQNYVYTDDKLMNHTLANYQTWHHEYDKKGRLIKSKLLSDDNELVRKKLYQYNEANNKEIIDEHLLKSNVIVNKRIQYSENGLLQSINIDNFKVGRDLFLEKTSYIYKYTNRKSNLGLLVD